MKPYDVMVFGFLIIKIAGVVINWVLISYISIVFKMLKQQHIISKFPSLAYPSTNYLCTAFMPGILVMMSLTPYIHVRCSNHIQLGFQALALLMLYVSQGQLKTNELDVISKQNHLINQTNIIFNPCHKSERFCKK